MRSMKKILTMNPQVLAAWTTSCTSLHSFGNYCLRLYLQQVKLKFFHLIKNIIDNFSDFYGGYLCFVVSILSIGVVTAIIGDVASHFGCTLGIKDSVTAIVFVALGTSIPGN